MISVKKPPGNPYFRWDCDT